jgi:hypothetical protein
VNEVRKAVVMRYGFVGLLEFWQYSFTPFGNGSSSEGLFAEYVIVFQQLRQFIRLSILGS